MPQEETKTDHSPGTELHKAPAPVQEAPDPDEDDFDDLDGKTSTIHSTSMPKTYRYAR